MIMLFKYDTDYNYIPGAEIFVEEGLAIPKSFTDVRPTDGFYKAKFDPGKQIWFESATQEYIDSLQPPPPKPSELDKMKKQLSDLTFKLLVNGVVK
ncbi:hypothetical protein A4A36_11500 [Bacillus subtilis]|uniref:hypothetical protein n=1 Tax=Bacillus subtilis group TaxID=653685 RepID=UPI0008FB5C96|nr:hypothetical protein [Bacillus subtilis]OIS58067.1 hypothetical protein A4A35_17990 [Bacillus subtilis]OIS69361.1 hypothetical protein A4A37_09515 [Bacillus subtilis]OIS70487.1 hypothetical protein A4A36_11500 [Bacillus subtilis]QHQ79452.1 hypothetical protein GPJ55_06590 [Bacillus subtilis]